MNTSGHEFVALEAEIPVLQQVFKKAGKEIPNLSAFIMSNWLTDVIKWSIR